MPSASQTLALCIAFFILGQLFEVSIHPSKTEYLVAPTGFSLTTLVAVVVSVLLIHDALVLFFLLRPPISRSADQQHRLESLAAAAADTIPDHRLVLRLPLADRPAAPMASGLTFDVPSTRNLSQSSCKVVRTDYSKALPTSIDSSTIDTRRMIIRVPRLFWRLFGPNVARSPVEYNTLLAPVIKICTPVVPHTRRLLDTQDAASLPRLSTTAATGLDFKTKYRAASLCKEEQVEDSVLDTTSLENEARPAHDTSPTPPRASQVPFLRHVAAAALLRRLGFRVVEEPSFASIEEVADDEGKVADEEVEQLGQVEEGQKAVEEIVVVDETKGVKNEKEKEAEIRGSSESGQESKTDGEGDHQKDVEGGVELVEKIVREEEPASSCVDALLKEFGPQEDMPADDLDALLHDELGLPSYEEFVRDLPIDPLFAKAVPAPAYGSSPSIQVLKFLFLQSPSRPPTAIVFGPRGAFWYPAETAQKHVRA
ncbi:hypothetical protein C8R47DRAFT_1227582 [Mycena vitilis]|nr:hypothetical protein C8R47DRAFT_1227582 [Mycena vitilis]